MSLNSVSFSYSQTANAFGFVFSILLKGTRASGMIIDSGFLIIGISKTPSNRAPFTNSGLHPSLRTAAFLAALSTTLLLFLRLRLFLTLSTASFSIQCLLKIELSLKLLYQPIRNILIIPIRMLCNTPKNRIIFLLSCLDHIHNARIIFDRTYTASNSTSLPKHEIIYYR